MNLTLAFSKEYRWLEYYFSVWSLENYQKLLTTNQSVQYFLQLWIFLFSVCLLISFNHHQRSESNQKQCSLCCGLPCFHVLLCTHYGPLECFWKYFRKLKEIGVLWPIYSDYVFLVTMNLLSKSAKTKSFPSFYQEHILYWKNMLLWWLKYILVFCLNICGTMQISR